MEEPEGRMGALLNRAGEKSLQEEEENGFYGFHCWTTKNTTAATARKTSWGRFDSEGSRDASYGENSF